MEKRPERKESGEWAKHLRPKLKKLFWRNTRRNAKKELKDYAQNR